MQEPSRATQPSVRLAPQPGGRAAASTQDVQMAYNVSNKAAQAQITVLGREACEGYHCMGTLTAGAATASEPLQGDGWRD